MSHSRDTKKEKKKPKAEKNQQTNKRKTIVDTINDKNKKK
jgi:hypothetical protein